MSKQNPSLFGLEKTNRDFSKKEAWGKNQFNSSFPAALCCYLDSKDIKAKYLSIQNKAFAVNEISIEKVFGIKATSKDIFFAFEASHTPFQKYVIGTLPRTDLVIQRKTSGKCLSGLEVKLTAIPDHTTCELDDEKYGSEIVVRPDTIAYLACSVASSLDKKLDKLVPDIEITDWSDPSKVLPQIKTIISAIQKIALNLEGAQKAFLVQPVWKTQGKSPRLSNNCLDVFVWSNSGFSYFLSKIANDNPNASKITRQTRTIIWLFKMLYDIKHNGQFNHEMIIDTLSYNTKNDKAFSSAGNVTNKYMKCARLKKPIILKSEIKNIILGGGQNMLSPERRFDAILSNAPGLF